MPPELNRRKFIQQSIITSTTGALAMKAGAASSPNPKSDTLPKGKIGDLPISRMLLGGNLLTHYTHSRDLKYVYNLAAHYNTEEKIHETLALAEEHGIDTLSIHTHPWSMNVIQNYRNQGGKIKWIVCPTAEIDDKMEAYSEHVKQIVDIGVDAVYLWGVRGDQLTTNKRIDLLGRAVEIAKECGALSGVGAHDLEAIKQCEKNNVDADFYIKTFHNHNYPTAPKPEEIKKPYQEFPGYWCADPKETIEVMSRVKKPWIAFKIMAAGAIPPKEAFQYAFDNGADHILVGMFDFEIAEDTKIAINALNNVKRTRPWYS